MGEVRMDPTQLDRSGDRGTSDVERAARGFAAALAETPEFKAFEEASTRFEEDERAKEAYRAFQVEQRALQPYVMLGAATDEQRADLDRLHAAFVSEPSAARLLEAQDSLSRLCGAIDPLLSAHIGLRFAATCSPGCCG